MWRTVKATRKGKMITLEFFEENWDEPKRRLHQVTIEEHRLMAELKRVGLKIPQPVSPEVLEQMTLGNEIAWYHSLQGLTGGTPGTGEQREELWSRITRKLRLR